MTMATILGTYLHRGSSSHIHFVLPLMGLVCCVLCCYGNCREFGSVFSWQLGNQQVTSILDYETIRSMLQLDGKVVSGWSPPSVYAMLGENTRRNMENPA